MRIVLDTNVLISGIFFGGPPGRVLSAWADGEFELVASVEIVAEYRRVVARLGRRFPAVDTRSILDVVIRESRLIDPVPVPPSACDDPDDLKFLACAVAGGAHAIVSGDRALLKASGYRGVEVLTPGAFVRRFTAR